MVRKLLFTALVAIPVSNHAFADDDSGVNRYHEMATNLMAQHNFSVNTHASLAQLSSTLTIGSQEHRNRLTAFILSLNSRVNASILQHELCDIKSIPENALSEQVKKQTMRICMGHYIASARIKVAYERSKHKIDSKTSDEINVLVDKFTEGAKLIKEQCKDTQDNTNCQRSLIKRMYAAIHRKLLLINKI